MKKDNPVFWPAADNRPEPEMPAPEVMEDVDPIANVERVRYKKNTPGGQVPGVPDATESIKATTALEPAIRQACRAQGIAAENFVVAQSHHGSWLVLFSAGQRQQRIVWDGKDQRLVLQGALRAGGWEDLREEKLAAASATDFSNGIATLMDSRKNA